MTHAQNALRALVAALAIGFLWSPSIALAQTLTKSFMQLDSQLILQIKSPPV